jgi:hypothetical protein
MEEMQRRFAESVPLAELLTTALQDLLHQGTQLPLNRDGAAGWVHDGCVWFVAKRMADQVREHLKQHLPDEGIPGEQKNDRLFDAWQEYGCIIPNPMSQQAIAGSKAAIDDNVSYVKLHQALCIAVSRPPGMSSCSITRAAPACCALCNPRTM